MLLYRLETNEKEVKARRGPYRYCEGKQLAHIAGVADCSADTHPVPNLDAGLARWWAYADDCWDYYFGFKDTNQYLNWFMYQYGRDDMVGKGVLAVYEVPTEFYRIGQFQAVAHKDHMEHLHDLCPSTLEIVRMADPIKPSLDFIETY